MSTPMSNENQPLSENNIKLLPIAEQTWRVAGSEQEGEDDARGNIDDLIETFGADYLAGIGQEFLMFLDVEGSPPSNPSLSPPTMRAGRELSPLIVSRRHRADLRSCPQCMPRGMTRKRGRHFNRMSLRVMPFGSLHMVPIRRNFQPGMRTRRRRRVRNSSAHSGVAIRRKSWFGSKPRLQSFQSLRIWLDGQTH